MVPAVGNIADNSIEATVSTSTNDIKDTSTLELRLSPTLQHVFRRANFVDPLSPVVKEVVYPISRLWT